MALVVLLATLPVAPARAQDDAGGLELRIAGQPVFHRDGDRLGFRLRIANEGPTDLEGFVIQVGAGGKVTTRSQLHAVFEAEDVDTFGSVAVPFSGEVVPAGSSVEVVVDEPIEELQGITGQEGVYPVTVELTDRFAAPLDSTVTTVLYYPSRVETPLKAVPVLPLQQPPARGPGGAFVPDETGSYPLESALAPGGWLWSYLESLDPLTERALEIALAPTPRLLEEVADMSDGYDKLVGGEVESVPADSDAARAAAEWLARLRTVTSRASVQPVLVPYGFADLPSIAPGPDEIGAQLRAGSDVTEDVLGAATATRAGRWLMPPGGRIDEAAFDQLPIGVEHAFFSFDALTPLPTPELSGCPEIAYSFTCPVRVQTPISGPATGLVFDDGIQERVAGLARPGDTRRELQELFAETAMIREEQPGRTDRVIAVAPPATWQPSASSSRTFLRGLARAPWLDAITPDAVLEAGAQVRRRSVVGDIGRPTAQPEAAYFEDIRRVAAIVAQYRSINPPAAVVERLTRNVLVAQSRAWWPDEAAGLEYAGQTEAEIEREFGQIRITGPQVITLTSRTGQIQFLILNETGYDVDVEVLIASENLVLRGEGLSPEEAVTAQHVESQQQRLTFDVTTQASGIFPVEVRLQTPDGMAIGDPVPLTVRSTEFNEIALGLTFGALAFLILFYVVRALRKGRRGAGGDVEAREV